MVIFYTQQNKLSQSNERKRIYCINCKVFFKTAVGWVVTCIIVGATSALLISQGAYSPTILGWGSCQAHNITV